MTPDEIRYLFDYDRWATERILAKLDGVPDEIVYKLLRGNAIKMLGLNLD